MPYIPKSIRKVTYEVIGAGGFPTDMLRYEHSHAASDQDQAAIDLTLRRKPLFRFIKLERFLPTFFRTDFVSGRFFPVYDRWRSFGWAVVDGSVKVERVPLSEVPDEYRQDDLKGK